MKKILIPLLLCVLISGCVVYRSKYFVPIDYDKNSGFLPPAYKIGRFENWDILITYFANPPRAYFGIWITAAAYDQKLSQYRDTKYRVHIKSLRILHGKNLQDEIIIPATQSYSSEGGKRVFFGNADTTTIHVPAHVKSVTVISEIEFIDKNGNSIVKKFIIPMNFKEETSIGPPLD